MKMKNFALFLVPLLFFSLASLAFAAILGSQESAEINFSDNVVTRAEVEVAEQTISNPGIAPDNPFYIFKRFGEFVRFTFAGSKEEKARLRTEFARNRAAEAAYLIRKNKTGEALKYIDEYNEELNRTAGIGANASVIAKETDSLLKSVLVLELVKEKVPESAKPAIDRAINNSLERKVRIKIETKIEKEEAEKKGVEESLSGTGLAGITIPAPPTKEERIEKELKEGLEEEKQAHNERVKSLKESLKEERRVLKRI